FPKYQKDAANFQSVQIILTEPELLPQAVQIYEPNGKDRKVYQFNNPEVNAVLNKLAGFINGFVRPAAPFGLSHGGHAPPLPVASQPQIPPGNQPQAQRPGLPAQR